MDRKGFGEPQGGAPMSWRQGGRRARRGDRDEPAPDQTAWLAELDETGENDEEDWARTLRDRRSLDPGASGGLQLPPAADQAPPPLAPEAPAAAAPAEPWAQAEPATTGLHPEPAEAGDRSGEWDVDWGTQDPLAGPTRAPDPDWSGWSLEPEPPLAWRAEGQPSTGSWPADPAGGTAVHGDPGSLPRTDPDEPWPNGPDGRAEGHTAGAPWPPAESSRDWEPSDNSWTWPVIEPPAATGGWETEPPPWMDDPPARPREPVAEAPAAAAWEAANEPWAPPPAVDEPATQAWPAPTGPARGRPESSAPPGPAAAEPASVWQPPPVPAPDPSAPPATATRAGPPAPTEPRGSERADRQEDRGGTSMEDPGGRARPAERDRPAGGRRARQAEERSRSSWPRVVAILSWIVLLMVICWFYVFPWLERVLPANF